MNLFLVISKGIELGVYRPEINVDIMARITESLKSF